MTFHGFPWPPVSMHPAAAKQNAHMVRRFAGMLAERVGRAPAVVKTKKTRTCQKKKFASPPPQPLYTASGALESSPHTGRSTTSDRRQVHRSDRHNTPSTTRLHHRFCKKNPARSVGPAIAYTVYPWLRWLTSSTCMH